MEQDIILFHLALRRGRAQRVSEEEIFASNERSCLHVVKWVMSDHYFNALEYAHQLEKAGVPTAQAEVHANALALVLENCFSSATEVEGAKSEVLYKISELEVKLRAEISTVEATLRAEIREAVASARTDLTERIDRLEARMEERFRWQWWANGVMVAMLIGLYFR